MKKYIPALCLAVVTVLILLTAASRPYYPITRPYKCPYPVGSDEWIAIRESSSAPPVDEATAALDAETAFRVSSALLALDGITCIVVTHNLDATLLSKYDSIITLKNGKIAESGRFDELIEKKGYFYSLFTVSQ